MSEKIIAANEMVLAQSKSLVFEEIEPEFVSVVDALVLGAEEVVEAVDCEFKVLEELVPKAELVEGTSEIVNNDVAGKTPRDSYARRIHSTLT